MMQRALRPAALVPRGFEVESAFCDGAATVITVRPTSDTSLCPGRGASSGRIHSRYQRRLTDLPLAGRPVRLVRVARRLRCVTVLCGRIGEVPSSSERAACIARKAEKFDNQNSRAASFLFVRRGTQSYDEFIAAVPL